MTSHVIAYRSTELLYSMKTFNFNCFFDDLNCVFTQIRCLSRLLCSGIQFNLLLSPYPCFVSLLYLDLYVLGDDALIS